MKLFLDDIRNPPDCSWVVARSYNEAIALVEQHGFPQEVSFDHDLGLVDCPLTGFSFAKYLVNLDIDTATMPENFFFTVHSANPVGAANILGLLEGYGKFKLEEKK